MLLFLCHDNVTTEVLCHDRDGHDKRSGVVTFMLQRVWSWQGISRSRQNFLCRDRESSRPRALISRHKFLCCDRDWSRPRDLMLGQSIQCRDKVFLCHDRDLQDKKFSMLRNSVICRESKALYCVETRLGVHDRDALSRQASYSGKKKKMDPQDLGRHNYYFKR